MSDWYLNVETETRVHRVVAGNEEAALKLLKETRGKLRGSEGPVVVADRLALNSSRILSVWIDQEPDAPLTG